MNLPLGAVTCERMITGQSAVLQKALTMMVATIIPVVFMMIASMPAVISIDTFPAINIPVKGMLLNIASYNTNERIIFISFCLNSM
jgi:type III secretory pathway component EscV